MTVKEHLAEKLKDPEFSRAWETHEDCRKQELELTWHIIEYRDARDSARRLVGQIQAWLSLESNITPHVKERLQERIREQVNWVEEEEAE